MCNSFLLGIQVNVTTNTTFVYVADSHGNAIIVHDVVGKTFWKMSYLQMAPNPDDSVFNIAGNTLQMVTGIINMAIAPNGTMHFRALSSRTENTVNITDLNNQNLVNSKNIFYVSRLYIS